MEMRHFHIVYIKTIVSQIEPGIKIIQHYTKVLTVWKLREWAAARWASRETSRAHVTVPAHFSRYLPN